MQLYRFIITPTSPWAGSLRSDTLYGLICWHIAECEGEARCGEVIEAFSAGQPPFMLSSAMPVERLPMPALAPISRARFRGLADRIEPGGDEALFAALQKYKKFRKRKWLPLSAWTGHKGALSAEALFCDLAASDAAEEKSPHEARMGLTAGSAGPAQVPEEKSEFEPHVAIDRRAGTAMDGQLFFLRLNYFPAGFRFHLYGRCGDPEYLLKYLKQIGELGFGRNASTGNGQFEAELDAQFDAAALDLGDADAQLLLSVCASGDMSALSGCYKLEVKRGKTGPGYENPFKKPFLMLSEGSVLTSAPAGPFVLRDLNADRRVTQIMQPLYLPCRLAGREDQDARLG